MMWNSVPIPAEKLKLRLTVDETTLIWDIHRHNSSYEPYITVVAHHPGTLLIDPYYIKRPVRTKWALKEKWITSTQKKVNDCLCELEGLTPRIDVPDGKEMPSRWLRFKTRWRSGYCFAGWEYQASIDWDEAIQEAKTRIVDKINRVLEAKEEIL